MIQFLKNSSSGYRAWCLCLCLLLFVVVCRAQPLSQEHARRLAQNFFEQTESLRKVRSVESASVRLVRSEAASGRFLFQGPSGCGFVLYGGTEKSPSLIAYSSEASAPAEAMPPAFELWLSGEAGRNIPSPDTLAESEVVAPILDVRWFQTDPYNGLCPYYTDSLGHVSATRCVVGCVATAYAQLLYHYRYPEALRDTLFGWSTPHYTIDDVLPGASLSWDLMRSDYTEPYTDREIKAVQQLNLYCGMACRMNYGVAESGSSIYRAVDALRRVFGYGYVRFADRYLYTPRRWHSLLLHELKQGRPVVYSGYNVRMEGHAFLIDGVDRSGFYHINWGSGGTWDGYFNLDALNRDEWLPDQTEEGRYLGYFCNQGAVLMHPDPVENELLSDTVAYADSLVTVEEVRFARQPDVAGYVPVDLLLTNHHRDTVNYTFEMFTYLPEDTAVFEQAEYLGVSGAILPPEVSRWVRGYCRFGRTGDFLFGTSSDDVRVSYSMPVRVKEAVSAVLRFSDIRLLSSSPDSMALVITVANESDTGISGDWMICALSQSGSWRDIIHQRFLQIPAGNTIQDTVVFRGLPSGASYRFRVCYPSLAEEQGSLQVKTDPSTGIVLSESLETDVLEAVYAWDGRIVWRSAKNGVGCRQLRLPRGIYLFRYRDGRVEKVVQTGW